MAVFPFKVEMVFSIFAAFFLMQIEIIIINSKIKNLMKKIVVSMLSLLMMTQLIFAQHYTVNRSDYSKIDLTFTTARVQPKVVTTENGVFTKITMEDYQLSTKVGKPQLPVMSQLIEIPLCEDVVATVTSSSYEEYDAATLGISGAIMPAQQPYPKSYRGERTFSKDMSVYSRNAFYSEALVSVEKIGVMRDVNMANIQVSPVAYNPVTNKVRIYSEINVEISFVNADVPGTYEMKAKFGSPLFQNARQAVINPAEITRDEYAVSPIKYLIVANSMFQNNEDLNNFISWKRRLGYIVEVGYTSDANVGTTTTSIKDFIMSHYNNATASNPAPTFLLLIGDRAQLPTFNGQTESHVTDLYYATFTSGDNLPDCYYGRFSATSVAQLVPQIQKTLMYEQYTMDDPSYLGKVVAVAGSDSYWSPTHANGQINYICDNYLNINSTTNQYTTIYKHLYNSSSQASVIRSEIGAGVGWANYTAHGGSDGWSDPAFSNSHVNSMSNANKYGVMIGNCCLTGKFDDDVCFGEALLRASNKGAMAYIGASNYSYWDEDYYWAVGYRSSVAATTNYDASNLGAYDKLFHSHGENHSVWTSCLGGIMAGGNLAVQATTSDLRAYYWEVYHLFGDPSIRPYLGMPSSMTVTGADALIIGATSCDVHAAPYAYCALTFNGELIGAAFADGNGDATITFPALTEPGEYELACGAQNYIQFFKTVNVVVPEGPYVIASDIQLAANNYPINGYTVNYNVMLKNIGVAAASNITATMTTTSNLATITQTTASQTGLAINQSATVNNAFVVVISEHAKDGDVIPLTVTVDWGNGTSVKNISLQVLAPRLQVVNYSIVPENGAIALAPGMQATVNVENKNVGHAPVISAVTDLTCNYSGLTVQSSSYTMIGVGPNISAMDAFTIQISNSVPVNSIIPLYYHTLMGSEYTIDTFYVTVGNVMEGFESGDLATFGWIGNNPWVVVSSSPYAGSYCARSKSNLGNNQTSTLQVTIESMMDGNFTYYRKVSSEGGYDIFSLRIDNDEKESLSGEVAWSQASFPVTAGVHTYKFSYSKDGSQTGGSDCAWIDNISFPGIGQMVVEDVIDLVGVEDYEANRVGVYPNPTTGSVNVASTVEIQKVEVYDLNGRLMESAQVNANTASLNLSSYANGIYFVKVFTADQNITVNKIVKK